MKTVEELKGMSQEDLIILVQQLQEGEKYEKGNAAYWYSKKLESDAKYGKLKNLITSVSALAE